MNINDYEIKQILGVGTFARTLLAIDKNTKIPYAIKEINIKTKALKTLGITLDHIDDEIQALIDLSYAPACSQYVSCYYISFIQDNNMYIIMEYIEGETLQVFLDNMLVQGKPIDPGTLIFIIGDLIEGLQYIHSKGYAHRDIKPANLMITDGAVIKYIDFGGACVEMCHREGCKNRCGETFGTILYSPPEEFAGHNEKSLRGSQAKDVWSLGVVIYQLLNGGANKLPFEISDSEGYQLPTEEIFNNIENAPLYESDYKWQESPKVAQALNNFVDAMLINNWRQRLNITQVNKLFLKTIINLKI